MPDTKNRQTFRFTAWEWDIDKAIELIALRESAEPDATVGVAEWDKLVVSHGPDGRIVNPDSIPFVSVSVQQDRVDAITDEDLARPLILARIVGADEDESFDVVIDGWHRLHAAAAQDIDRLPAYALTVDEERACRTFGSADHPAEMAAAKAARTKAARGIVSDLCDAAGHFVDDDPVDIEEGLDDTTFVVELPTDNGGRRRYAVQVEELP